MTLFKDVFVVSGCMQTLDNSTRLRPKRNLLGLGPRLQTREDADNPNPRFIAVADQVTRRAAEKLGATPQTGVVDAHHRAFGYENLLVCDGSAIPANIGVNPSLTITAMAEHPMTHVPPRDPGPAPAERDMDVAHR